jgi:hypothetical protein
MKAVPVDRQRKKPPGLERATQDIRAVSMMVPCDLPFLDAMVKNHSTQRKTGSEN